MVMYGIKKWWLMVGLVPDLHLITKVVIMIKIIIYLIMYHSLLYSPHTRGIEKLAVSLWFVSL